MIGNYFTLDEYSVYMYVTEIYNDLVYMSDVNNTGGLELYIKELKPIPLTEEILLKAGFERQRFIFSLNYLRDCFSSCSFCISIVEDKLFYDWLCANVEIKYLHQLQNLFKVLTGNNLKLNI